MGAMETTRRYHRPPFEEVLEAWETGAKVFEKTDAVGIMEEVVREARCVGQEVPDANDLARVPLEARQDPGRLVGQAELPLFD